MLPSLNKLSDVIKKLANIPVFKEPTRLSTFIIEAGVEVKAAKATFSSKPFSIAFLRLAMKSAFDFKLEVVKAKLIPAFDKIPALAGAISQCFISVNKTIFSSKGSSTSGVTGKFNGKIKLTPAAFTSSKR